MGDLIVVAGPCVIQDEQHTLEIAHALAELLSKYPVNFYFKASIDKANRTSVDSFRGTDWQTGCEILKKVRDNYCVKTITDVHETWQPELVWSVVDVIQIPAMLSRQTDLIVEAAKFAPLNIKKSQGAAPESMQHAITKAGRSDCWITERGTTFGYHNLVVDMRNIQIMKQYAPVIIDCTHSNQSPGGKTTDGNRAFAPLIANCGIAAGADGVFFETQFDPDKALSDGPNSIKFSEVERMIETLLRIRDAR